MRTLTALVLLLAAGLAWAATAYKVGDEVTDVSLAMADGKDVKLSSHEGSTVLLYFYGTWTRHAGEEAKQVEAIRKARAKQKLVVIGIARDAKAEDAKKFAEDNKLGFSQATDAKSELYGKFASKGLPWIAILDGKRKLKHSAAGIDEDAIEETLKGLLGAKDPAADEKDPKKDDGGGKR